MVDRPSPESIIEKAHEREQRFTDAVSATEFDFYGMWYSELFTFALCCEVTGCDRIIESGRARGFSTKVLSEYFAGTDVKIVSIEHKKGTKADRIARSKLSDADNVTLRYGDSRELLPELLGDSTGVLIDGPKDDGALQLAIRALETEEPPIVAVHDLHKGSLHRDLSELIFPKHIYTDNPQLVDEFHHLDQQIDDWNADEQIEWWDDVFYGPNQRPVDDGRSYGPTLGVFFGGESGLNHRVKDNYQEYISEERGLVPLVGDFLTYLQVNGGPISSRLAALSTDIGRRILGSKRK